MEQYTLQNKTAAAVNSFDHALPRGYLEWLLLPLIIGFMTLSYIDGWSTIIVLYGVSLAILFLINFLYLKLKLQPEVILYFAWIVWSGIGVLNAKDLTLFVGSLMTIIQTGIMIFVIAGTAAAYRNLSVVMLAIAIGGIIVALSGFFSGELQVASAIESRKQVEGLTGNANEFAYHLLFIIIAIFCVWKNKRSLWRPILGSIVVVVCVMTIVYSGSRKGFLGVLAFMSLWFLFCQGKKMFTRPFISLAILIILSGGIYFLTDYVMSSTYMGERFEDVRKRGEVMRVQMYLEGFDMIKNHPIVGVGLNNYRVLSTFGMYSHSDYIEVAANTGMVGFFLYFSIYFVLWRRLKRIQTMTDDPHLLYVSGVLKAAIITILLVALGRPNFDSKLTMVFLASVIGYSCSIERVLLSKL